MSRRATRDTPQANSLLRYFPLPPAPPLPSEGKKKLTLPPTSPSSPEQPPKTLPLRHYLRSLSLGEVLEGCPQMARVLSQLQVGSGLQERVLQSILKKHLQGGEHSLWSHKYRPLECLQLFNEAMGERIREWVWAFHEYRQTINEEDESYFNQHFDQHSGKVCDAIFKYNWKLEALVVQGPPGIGKSSAVRAVTTQMGYELQECGNDYNQTKYLKEKNQSTQSESVKTAMSRKPKVDPQAQMITKFIPPAAPKERPNKEHRKAQLIHNVGDVHPSHQANRFYHQLARCVSLSKIPFILTNSADRLPRECQNYDRVEYELGSHSKIERTLWAIYHIEQLLKLNRSVGVERGGVVEELRRQTEGVRFREVCGLETIRQVCKLHNYRLDYIFTFLQHRPPPSPQHLQLLLREKLARITPEQLLSQIRHSEWQHMDRERKAVLEGRTLRQCRMQLDIQKIEDQLGFQQDSGQLYDNHFRLEQSAATFIDSNVHRSIKQSLAHLLNQQINTSHDKIRSSFTSQQLYTLPMLFRERRSSRSASKITQTQQNNHNESLLKVYTQNQCIYLKQFGHFLNPS